MKTPPNPVATPTYDRAALTPGIVHIGLGNFHRAHMAVYLDDLMTMGLAQDWAILGAGVRSGDAQMRDALLAQDCLSTIIELDPKGRTARRVGAMTGFIAVQPDNAALIAAMTDPAIRIVSMTVTEGGYFIDAATGQFDTDAAEIAHDAAHPATPKTAFGAILAALKARRAAGVAPFTVMSCDNLPGNGHVTQSAITGLARLSDPGFADWILANVAFPNGMVDRITPATGPRERAMAAEFGLGDDPVPVTCEPFRQWVLEDHFPTGRPAWEKVGVTFTDDVHAYEAMKIRILNGGHATIAYPGGLMDVEYVHESIANPLISRFLDKVEREEIIPYVAPVLNTDLHAYYDLIRARFSNPEIADTLRRLCLDGSNRQPKFIIPSLRDALAAGGSIEGLALVSALWCRYCAGTTDSGTPIEPNDPDWDNLHRLSLAAKSDPSVWTRQKTIYGEAGSDPRFAAAFATALNALWANGTAKTLSRYLGD
ncbi:MAG: mannitol dehydrogenase family protein [Pseudotabrizicola sp.]|uniref:mannitol dehydrogenase family protein n=1 Tax=Pseudotabrizicola sp. TaxID=2939647 RepID=UPI0027317BAB|nr:mannitol dehydrogenase family protein [Pseudotabrizicola sp.]MDP2083323.1 mannitol dehydrogenase family protein [Pseudotabrizicola sp.]MDZ7575874.1 mannitol dehydrogenase family protein [Pseudotabrizicola sp.]